MVLDVSTEDMPSVEDLIGRHIAARGKPYFMQVGAFDGVTADPLFPSVIRYQLEGCLIEPQLEAFQKLRENYRAAGRGQCVFVNAAIGACDGTASLHRVRPDVTDGPEWMHQLASFDRSVVLSHALHVKNLEASLISDSVPCITFATLFEQHRLPKVDLLQIDTEGSDALMLRLFDLPARTPAIVAFEHKHLRVSDYLETVSLLASLGYRVGTNAQRRDDTIAYLL